MSDKEIIALLRMQRIPGIGPRTCRRLIDRCGSPEAVFADQGQCGGAGLREDICLALSDPRHQVAAEEEFEFAGRSGIRVLSFLEPEYPHLLAQCQDAPVVLFSKGNLDLTAGPVVSVVGTRRMTSYGRAFCERFISDLAPLRPVIVSGFAYGVDITAQREAMRHGLQTISCMAHGLDQVYPDAHRVFSGGLMENGGFLSEFWSGTPPEPGNFLRRNRIIAGMSEATVVVESAETGGSLVTADLAFGYDREVFAVPGRAFDTFSAGCNRLISRNKAQLLESAESFRNAMQWDAGGNAHPAKPDSDARQSLKASERVILEYLASAPARLLDEITFSCGLEVSEAITLLFSLEMMGLVEQLPGKKFILRT